MNNVIYRDHVEALIEAVQALALQTERIANLLDARDKREVAELERQERLAEMKAEREYERKRGL